MLSKYQLVSKLYDGKTLLGYRLLTDNGVEYDEDLINVKLLAKRGQIIGITVDKRGNLHSDGTIDMRKLPRVSIFKSNLSTLVTGGNIKSLYDSISNYRPRYCFNKLKQYLDNPTDKVCTVYGLRRTGKTVLLLQSINYLNYKDCVYISLNKSDKSINLLKVLNDCYSKGIKYVFIDEITVLDDLLYFIQTLADNYVKRGMHIVISGTDSYLLGIASNGVLYNRCVIIKTTYVSFKEYNYLLGTTDIKDYIHYGGVLNRDAFYDINSMHQYMTTAISDNIQHSVEVVGRNKFGKLYDLISLGLFRRCLEAAIQHTNEELTISVLIENFKSKDIGSVKQMLGDSIDFSRLDIGGIAEQLRYYLHYSNINKTDNDSVVNNLMSEYYDTFVNILRALNLIVCVKHFIDRKVSDNILFTLPGLRYNQLKEALSSFVNNDSFQNISKRDRVLILDKLEQDIYGQLSEQVVLLELLLQYGYDKIYKFNGLQGEEIDCIVEVSDTEIDLIEIKLSDKVVSNQYKHLINVAFNKRIAEILGYTIRKRIVVYSGVDQKTKDTTDIDYININSFLLNTKMYL